MRSIKTLLGGLAAAALLSACAVTTASFPPSAPSKGNTVTATRSHFSILYLNAFKDTDALISQLGAQCPDGSVEGITVTMVNRFWSIAGLHYSYRAAGTCVK